MKRKERRSFNFIDIIVLLFVIAVTSVLLYVFISPYTEELISTPTYTIEYKIQVEKMREEFKGKVNKGDRVIDTKDLNYIGEVTTIEYTPCIYTGSDSAGNNVTSNYPGLCNMILTVRVNATISDGIYKVGSFPIMAGSNVGFRVPGFTSVGYCTSLKEVTANE